MGRLDRVSKLLLFLFSKGKGCAEENGEVMAETEALVGVGSGKGGGCRGKGGSKGGGGGWRSKGGWCRGKGV